MTEEKKTGLPEEKNTGALKGFRIQSLSLWLVAFTLIISVLIGIGIVQVMKDYYELAQRTREYVFAQEDARDLLFGSNYLTDQARLYAVTKDHVYAEAYFTEVHETRRRDLALEALEVHLRERNESLLNIYITNVFPFPVFPFGNPSPCLFLTHPPTPIFPL